MTSKPAAPAIRKLDELVVNKIAAGEVIQRPASALKELLENSLDAGSTSITVTVKDGGIKLLQITDNGHGIRKADLPILCHRHTTSKLKAFEDLETISTLGFRGEALCSISCVSNLTVTTMVPGALHGWRVSYKDSEPVPPGPKPIAAVQGTTLSVEDLFYNVPTRRKALKSASEEYARVLDVVSRYAVFKTGVAFCCKRQGESRSDVTTLAAASRLDNIKSVFGAAVAKDLLPIKIMEGQAITPDLDVDVPCSFKCEGYVSSADYSSKSSTFILFVNERLVDCPPLKRALEATYAAVLPKASKPWMFLDLRLPPRHVEVNMHPTKREVGLLNQEALVDRVRVAVESLLLASNTSRTFTQTQLQIPGAQAVLPSITPTGDAGPSGGAASVYRPHKLVRTDAKAQTMEAFLNTQFNNPRAAAVAGSVGRKRRAAGDLNDPNTSTVLDLTPDPLSMDYSTLGTVDISQGMTAGGRPTGASSAPLGVVTDLDSIRDLAAAQEKDVHEGLCDLLKNHTLVGMASDTLALVQHLTKLYLVDVATLSRDLFYQQALRCWERCERYYLDPRPNVSDLMSLALQHQAVASKWKDPSNDAQVCELTVEMLQEKTPMLMEYLGIEVDDQGCLVSLPLLLPGYTPDLGYLPDFILSLAREVDWEEEQACFQGLAQALADLYGLKAPLMPVYRTNTSATPTQLLTAATERADGPSSCVKDAEQPPTIINQDSNTSAAVLVGQSTDSQRHQGIATAQGIAPQHAVSQGPGQAEEVSNEPDTGGVQTSRKGNGLPGAVPVQDVDMLLDVDVDDTEQANTEADVLTRSPALQQGQQLQEHQGTAPNTQTINIESKPMDMDVDKNDDQAKAEDHEEIRNGSVVERDAVLIGPTEKELQARSYMIKHVLFPALRAQLRPSKKRAMDGTFVLVTSLEKLYRIFERC